MIISYEEFVKQLNATLHRDEDFYMRLLKKVIDYPERYCGLFRLSNPKTKLVQNVTQSNEIKFGDFMENIVTYYIELLGYQNLDKNLGTNASGNRLSIDQLFRYGDNIVLIEQKIRDDHDSTKKRGQFDNFRKKVEVIRRKYSQEHLISVMWFVDDSLNKNERFYREEMKKVSIANCEFHLFYGKELPNFLDESKMPQVWGEITEYLQKYKATAGDQLLDIADFKDSKEILDALLKLDETRWKKLISKDKKFAQLRDELFSDGKNLKQAEQIRKKKSQK